MTIHLTVEQRQLARRLSARGLSLREVGRQVGCSHEIVRTVVRRESKRPVRSDSWQPGPGRLTLADREEISLGLRGGESFTAIAARLGKATSTVSREVAGNGGRDDYRAWRAHQRARARARRPKTPKLACVRLAGRVGEWLEDWWSPEEISRRLPIEFPRDPLMRVSHETIYRALFVQGRGELRRELARCLRTGRIKRRARQRPENTGRIPDMVMISERPAEADDRAVPGHWEGDLILGKDSKSAVGTLVERSTRFLLLLHLPHGRTAHSVEQAMRKAIATLPDELVRTITWDQGKEMSQHAQFTAATGIQVYFCDPHKPWQRGSNENTNGLLRQYMPKGTDLSAHTADDLARFARSLNTRPRKTLGYMTPSEKLAELLAHTG
ncbi:IS30 family transposase [Micromonospora sp. NBC_00858]|nr:IS30 family transposase [Micromonospora sp. NBC_00858]WSZ91624.1 IS30 family transposase [Micromonospora sp. NBC_00858]